MSNDINVILRQVYGKVSQKNKELNTYIIVSFILKCFVLYSLILSSFETHFIKYIYTYSFGKLDRFITMNIC